MKLLLCAGVIVLAGCSSVSDFHADAHRQTQCGVKDRVSIEAHDTRTGFPLFSTPHRYSCYLDAKNEVVWVVEQESEASLQAFSDLPSAAIQRGIPASTVNY